MAFALKMSAAAESSSTVSENLRLPRTAAASASSSAASMSLRVGWSAITRTICRNSETVREVSLPVCSSWSAICWSSLAGGREHLQEQAGEAFLPNRAERGQRWAVRALVISLPLHQQ
jgi:hypothetical protein